MMKNSLTPSDQSLLTFWRDYRNRLSPKDFGAPSNEMEWCLVQLIREHAMDWFIASEFCLTLGANRERLNYRLNRQAKTRNLIYV